MTALFVLQVWVHAEMDSNGLVRFGADSDSELTRGLAAVLVEALSGLTAERILQVGIQHVSCSCMGQRKLLDSLQPDNAQDTDRILTSCRWSQKRSRSLTWVRQC